MKALIFNSGLGSRLGALTADRPKSLVRLGNGETILGRQLRLLSGCGIREFVITTGPFPEKVEAEARRFEARGCTFSFVPNPIYAETNAIYSMHCARGLLGVRNACRMRAHRASRSLRMGRPRRAARNAARPAMVGA